MKRIAILTTLIGVLTLAMACTPPTEEKQPRSTWVLRTYVVPHNNANNLRSLLKDTVSGEFELTPGGKLLVHADTNVHDGVEMLIDDLEKSGPQQSAGPVTLTYWLILGREGSVPKTPEAFVTHGFPKKGLTEVMPALKALNTSQGPLEFALLERVQIVGTEDRRSHANGQFAEISQFIRRANGNIEAEVKINPVGPPHLETQLRLEPSKFLVLGQTAFEEKFLHGPSPFKGGNGQSLMLFYVIRAEV